MTKCPSCARDCADRSRFCAWCAAPLDETSAETALLTSVSVPRLSTTSSVDEGRFLPGTVLAGRYRIAGLLGRGGMGEVYRATDLTLGQAVALKFLPEATARDERALGRFYNEVRIARQVTHPNVCRVYDVGQVEGQHYISMEFVDGEDLGSLLRRIGRLPVDKAVETARRLCAGLAAAHEKGVLHRDLKPANVMIDGRGQVIIMDFGLAGLAEQLQGDIRSGTPAYMAPEQLAGTGVTIKSDIYALGLLLYEVFTGKRAFEAASLIELMQMQERAAPASITSVVRDLDPAVERLILRCLQPDPRQRPPTVAAVAAALPGGDPLAAAMAAGETPSPDLVAAAGETEGLRPNAALWWLAAALGGLAVCTVLAPTQSITSRLPLDNSPDALTRDARSVLKSFGYTAKPADTAWGLTYDDAYQAYLVRHQKESVSRFRNPAAGQPPLVKFWYRESPDPIVALRRFNVAVNYSDPPLEQSGAVRLQLDPDGKLQMLEAVPPQVENEAPPSGPIDWNKLFVAAGIEMASFQNAEPRWTPLANWDTRAAWTGVDAPTGAKLRIEAAAWRGRPIFFRIIGPWTVASRMPPDSMPNRMPMLVVVYLAMTSACVLAWHNFRAGKSDQRGAASLCILYFSCQAAARLLSMHHSASLAELEEFWISIGAALVNSSLTWIFYTALEPWVRRRWPQTMISWTRYTSRGIKDPLVGRDLLYGVVLGLLMALCTLAAPALGGNNHQPNFPGLDTLLGLRRELAGILMGVTSAIFTALIFFFVLFVLRVLLRKQWLAAGAFVVILTFVISFNTTTPWVDFPIYALFAAIYAFALLRFGLLAAFTAHTTVQILEENTPTMDFSSWYAGLAFLPVLMVALIAIFAWRVSLGGRSVFTVE